MTETGNEIDSLITRMNGVIDEMKALAHRAVDGGDIEGARRLLSVVETQSHVSAGLQDLANQIPKSETNRPIDDGSHRFVKPRRKRLQPGMRTPQEEFRRPILESLIELGGTAEVADVLDRVGEKMDGILNDQDLDSLPSDSRQARWRNTAQWARLELVKQGLMSNSSPRGIWEITRLGRDWLDGRTTGSDA